MNKLNTHILVALCATTIPAFCAHNQKQALPGHTPDTLHALYQQLKLADQEQKKLEKALLKSEKSPQTQKEIQKQIDVQVTLIKSLKKQLIEKEIMAYRQLITLSTPYIRRNDRSPSNIRIVAIVKAASSRIRILNQQLAVLS